MLQRILLFVLLTNFTIHYKCVVSETLIENKKQSGKVMETIQPSGIKMCAKHCLKENRCQSFNFERETFSCEMLSKEDPSSYIDAKGYVHSDIKKWSKEFAGSCGINNCSVEERCVPLRKGDKTCIEIGCVGIQYTYDDATGLCYHIYQELKTWTDASEYCQSEGGRLIVLDTQEKVNYFPPSEHKSNPIYVGLTDSETEGTFKWVSGSNVVHKKWQPHQPNDYDERHPFESADCISTRYGFWFDDNCQVKHRFSCERPDLSLK